MWVREFGLVQTLNSKPVLNLVSMSQDLLKIHIQMTNQRKGFESILT